MNSKSSFNPTPISKILVTFILSFTITGNVHEIFTISIIILIASLFALNNRAKEAIRVFVFYLIVSMGLRITADLNDCFIKNTLLTLLVAIKIFFLPLLAGNFLISTSDVSSLIVSFEKMRLPKVIVIPLAVMFRYFPAFRDDKKHIKMAMRMRGITFRNPIRYLEYISVPILISASNIGNDISMSAETKCISDPCKKTRYYEVKFRIIDFVYVFAIIVLCIFGRMHA